MGPVRIGNLAYLQVQHDAYGEVILAARPLFAGDRLDPRAETRLFAALEKVGDQAVAFHDQPDAGLWELRGKERVHTFSSVMCWAACNALGDIAVEMGLPEREAHWRQSAEQIREAIHRRSWNVELNAYSAAMEGDSLDAALLLMHKLGFIDADDPRFVGTVRAIGRDLKRGELIYRYVEKDDFGEPENAFLVCTLWYVEALAAIGETAEARRVFSIVLSHCNRHGLLAEHVDPRTGEQWGNFVQTYSMAGIIDAAMLLSGK
jgi:GH15 family glucan-1,4-alpha-glucosidase